MGREVNPRNMSSNLISGSSGVDALNGFQRVIVVMGYLLNKSTRNFSCTVDVTLRHAAIGNKLRVHERIGG
jgi:hypothetical protein